MFTEYILPFLNHYITQIFVVGIMAPVVAFHVKIALGKAAEKGAAALVIDEPSLNVGTLLTRVECEGYHSTIMGRSVVPALCDKTGRMVITSLDGTESLPLSATEFLSAHTFVESVPGYAGAQPQAVQQGVAQGYQPPPPPVTPQPGR